MPFRGRCLLGLDADLGSSFSFDVCIIGVTNRMSLITVCVCVFVLYSTDSA